jgi:hypothetical protein
VDYSSAFPEAIIAQGRNKDFLVLYKLDAPFKRFDGETADYELVYRELSHTCETSRDEAWACTLSQESTYWKKEEIPIDKIESGEISLFDCFNIL